LPRRVTITDPFYGYSRNCRREATVWFTISRSLRLQFHIRATHYGIQKLRRPLYRRKRVRQLCLISLLKVGAVRETITVRGVAIQWKIPNGNWPPDQWRAGSWSFLKTAATKKFPAARASVPGVARGRSFSAQGKRLVEGRIRLVHKRWRRWMPTSGWLDGAHNNDVGSKRTILVFPLRDAID